MYVVCDRLFSRIGRTEEPFHLLDGGENNLSSKRMMDGWMDGMGWDGMGLFESSLFALSFVKGY